MSTREQLESYYNSVVSAAVTLNSQYIFYHGDFNNERLIEARERLRAMCKENNLDMIILPDGEDAVLIVQTKEKEVVLQIVMNVRTLLDMEENDEE